MGSKLLRRSGVAFVTVADWLNWKPDHVYIAGVGQNFQEVDVIRERWPDVTFHGVEPNPKVCFDSARRFPGKIVQTAVGDYVGRAKLQVKRAHKDGSSLFPFDRLSSCEIEVPITTIDLLWKLAVPNAVLWLDVEGYELPALKGAVGFLSTVDVVNVEMTPMPPGGEWSSPESVHDFLRDHGFYQQWIHTLRRGQYDAVYVRRPLFDPQHCSSVWQVREWRSQ